MNFKTKEKGSALIPILLILLLFSIFSILILQDSNLLNLDIKKLRIRSMISILENNLRTTIVQPFAFVDCNSTIGPTSCNVDWSYIQQIGTSSITLAPSKANPSVLRYTLPQARCPVTLPNCGLHLKDASLDLSFAEPKFIATIEYEGIDLTLRPVKVEVTIPKNLLQQDEFRCDSGFFSGFDSRGVIQCRQPRTCSAGEYASSINGNVKKIVSP